MNLTTPGFQRENGPGWLQLALSDEKCFFWAVHTPSTPSPSIWSRKLPRWVPFGIVVFILFVTWVVHFSATHPENPIVKLIGRLILGN